MMSSQQRAQGRAEDIERATAAATTLVQDHFDDPEAWVRLAFSEGAVDDQVYHFDAFGPTLNERPQVLVSFTRGHWLAVLAS